MKKIFTLLLIFISILQVTNAATPDFTETVFPWLQTSGLTKYTNIADFRGGDLITRGEAAKFITQYAKKIGLEKNYFSCTFNDLEGYDSTLIPYIQSACAYGLLKGSNNKFMPNDTITEAQAVAVVIRSLEGFHDETLTPRYKMYYMNGQDYKLIEKETLESVGYTKITRSKIGTRFFIGTENYERLHPQKNDTGTDDITDVEKNIDSASSSPENISPSIQKTLNNDSSIQKTVDRVINDIDLPNASIPLGTKELSFGVKVQNIGNGIYDLDTLFPGGLKTIPIEIQCFDENGLMIASSQVKENNVFKNLAPTEVITVPMHVYPGYMGLNQDPKPIFLTAGTKRITCTIAQVVPISKPESDISNNSKSFPFIIEVSKQKSDLIVSDITIGDFSCATFNSNSLRQFGAVNTCDQIDIKYSIKNIGSADIDSSINVKQKFLHSRDGYSWIDFGKTMEGVNKFALKQNSEYKTTYSTSIDLNQYAPGIYSITITVDPDNIVPESDETNNESIFYFSKGGA